jgi:hypothetical protein
MQHRRFELGAAAIAIIEAIHVLVTAFAAFDHWSKLPHARRPDPKKSFRFVQQHVTMKLVPSGATLPFVNP